MFHVSLDFSGFGGTLYPIFGVHDVEAAGVDQFVDCAVDGSPISVVAHVGVVVESYLEGEVRVIFAQSTF